MTEAISTAQVQGCRFRVYLFPLDLFSVAEVNRIPGELETARLETAAAGQADDFDRVLRTRKRMTKPFVDDMAATLARDAEQTIKGG